MALYTEILRIPLIRKRTSWNSRDFTKCRMELYGISKNYPNKE
jgi:hypothetical protein